MMYVLKGAPGTGKSTFARKTARANPRNIIISRDSIRSAVGKYWVPFREPLITDLESAMIKASLENGYNVTVDATNIGSDDRFELIAKETNTSVSRVYFYKPLFLAYFFVIKRWIFGGKYIPLSVVKKMHRKYVALYGKRKSSI